MPFWSKSQEKPAEDPAADRAPEPSDEVNSADKGQSEPAHADPAAATNTPTPEDKDAASAQSGSTWGSRLNTAKQLYGTANQVYTVAQAVPQARAALEPYLTKASTTEDPKSENEPVADPAGSTEEIPELPPQTEKEASNVEPESGLAKDASEIETPPQPHADPKTLGDPTKPSSESTPEEKTPQEDTAVENTAAGQDAEAPNPTPKAKDEVLAGSSNPSDTNLSSTSAGPEEVTTAQDSTSKEIASQDGGILKDAAPMHAEATTKDAAREQSDETIGSDTDKKADTVPAEDTSLGDIDPKDAPTIKDESGAQSGTAAEKEVPKTFRKGLVFARERAEKDSSDKNATSNDTSVPGEASAVDVDTVPEAEDEAPDANDKTLKPQEDEPTTSTREQPQATDDASEPISMVNKESETQLEPSSGTSVPDVQDPAEHPDKEVPDTSPAPDSNTTQSTVSNSVSQPGDHSLVATDAHPVSSVHNVASTQDSEETSDAKISSESPTNDESASKPTQSGSNAQEIPDPQPAEAQNAAATPDEADGSEPAPGTQQPTPEEVEKAADAAKAAARLQSTADTLWAQARAVRDPAERERLWRAAYNKEVEAHGQSKKARTMASGWGQGVLSGVGLSAAVGVGLGNVVGALLGGVVSVPGSLIGAGVGAAMGPLVKLGGYGGKSEKSKEEERPKEFDWEEDLSDDEEHRQIVDAVRKDEATAKGDTKDEEDS